MQRQFGNFLVVVIATEHKRQNNRSITAARGDTSCSVRDPLWISWQASFPTGYRAWYGFGGGRQRVERSSKGTSQGTSPVSSTRRRGGCSLSTQQISPMGRGRMRIAIVGTGGIGAPLGVSLATAGQDVIFLARG